MKETAHTTAVASMRTGWGLFSAYWKSDRKKRAIPVAAGIATLILFNAYFGVQIADMTNHVWNSLLARDLNQIGPEVATFLGLTFGVAACNSLRSYWGSKLHIDWRGWMTQQFTDAVTGNNALSHLAKFIKDFDYRANEDPLALISHWIGLGQGGLVALSNLSLFLGAMAGAVGYKWTPLMQDSFSIPVPSSAFWPWRRHGHGLGCRLHRNRAQDRPAAGVDQ